MIPDSVGFPSNERRSLILAFAFDNPVEDGRACLTHVSDEANVRRPVITRSVALARARGRDEVDQSVGLY